MKSKTCPHCGKTSYSAATTGIWLCPYCGEDITEVEIDTVTTHD